MESYPSHMRYDQRKDLLVIRVPEKAPTELPPSGKLEEGIANVVQFGGVVLDPKQVPAPDQELLTDFLEKTFGIPAAPAIVGDAQAEQAATKLQLSPQELLLGASLYRRRCQDCHGMNGDGRGPTGPWIHPHPRDYRQGVFKFVTTPGVSARKARHADLVRTLTYGLPGTSMPSFGLLPEAELSQIAHYVVYLSIRGRVEFQIIREILENPHEFDWESRPKEILNRQLSEWVGAEESVPVQITAYEVSTPQHQESVRRGYELFTKPNGAGCISCHAQFGQDGKWQFDVWGTLVRPGNLIEARRKGGKSVQDHYHRVTGGIGPSNMPALVGKSDQMAIDLAHFTASLPYPDQLPPDIRAIVYPDGK
ncbi:MAG: c-type cytochrome [Zavarzinella sp.]